MINGMMCMKSKHLFATLAAIMISSAIFSGCISSNLQQSPNSILSAQEQYYDPLLDGPVYEYSDWGSAVSDFGSHYGMKNIIGDNKPMHMMAIGCRTAWGMPGVNLGEVWLSFESAGAEMEMAQRNVSWRPYGWEEFFSSGQMSVHGTLCFVATDAILVYAKITNSGSSELSLLPSINFHGEMTMNNGRDQTPSIFLEAHASMEGNAINLASTSPSLGWGSTPGPLLMPYTEYRQFKAGFALDNFKFNSFQSGQNFGGYSSWAYDGKAIGSEMKIPAGQNAEIYFVTGFARDNEADAAAICESGFSKVGNNPAAAISAVVNDWKQYFEILPNPHASDPKIKRLYYLAATALRMNSYAPIDAMTGWCVVPCKAFYNAFYGWDTPYNAMGFTESNMTLAEETLITQFQVQSITGCIPGVFGDDMTAYSHTQGPSIPLVLEDTQAPTQGLAILRTIERETDSSRLKWFLDSIYAPAKKYADWWATYRDMNGDLIIEVDKNDDASFYASNSYGQYPYPLTSVSPMNYNAYYNLLLQAVAKMAQMVNNSADALLYSQKAKDHSGAVASLMWNDADFNWHSTYSYVSAAPSSQDTGNALDSMLMALYASDCDGNYTMINEYINRHLLNPQEYFGRYPFPSVAYNDPGYGPASGWSGKLWINYAEPALELLYKYGYEDQASEAFGRLSEMMANNTQGIFEAYNSQEGKGVRFWQFSWTSTFTMEMLLDRWQRERIISEDETSFEGYVKRATDRNGVQFYSVETGSYEIPLSRILSEGGSPLTGSTSIKLSLEDQYGNVKSGEVEVKVRSAEFTAKIGHSYHIDMIKGKATDLTEEKGKFLGIPGFETLLLVAAAVLVIGKKSLRYEK
jgi:hypothetical protein